MRESELHRLIYERSAGLVGPLASGGEVLVGPGDDCAVLKTPGGDRLLLTTDQLIAGRHFETGTATDLIARKAMARSISDIAAMGGTPTAALATALLPHDESQADALFDAMHRWATHCGAPLVGGDVASHADRADQPLTLTTTVIGRMADGVSPLLRSGARVGDAVFVTGAIGGSLASGRHLTFEPRVELGQQAAASGSVRAAIDLSDGLGRDADRVAQASGVRLVIEADRVPKHRDAGEWRKAFSAGEDYELLLVGDPAWSADGVTIIGRIEPGVPGAVVVAGSEEHPARDLGWDH